MDSEVEVGAINRGTRKRKVQVSRRERQKRLRYTDHFPNLENVELTNCKHKGKSTFQCPTAKKEELVLLREKVYQENNKISQDTKLSHMMSVYHTKKPKKTRAARKRNRNMKVVYTLRLDGNNYRVCQNFFSKVFGVSKRRLLTIAQRMEAGTGIKENRGGDRRSRHLEAKRENLKKFIMKLRGHESHYNRKKSARLYLPSELNISKLCKMYNENAPENLRVNYWYFFNFFTKNFNIGFGSPATDICSLCYRLKNQLKTVKDEAEKVNIMTQYRIHDLRWKAFSALMRENKRNSVKFCFDMEQVQPLPKLPISENYYSNQISFYTLCITDVKTHNPYFYNWTEDIAGRGANEVGSALIDFLCNYEYPEDCELIRLFADGCAGQNKNNMVLHALMKILHDRLPKQIKEIQITFPVRGHSYMPADRVFGRVEKILRAHSEIVTKDDYYNIYKQVGIVKKLGIDWKLYDLKNLDHGLKKYTGVSQMKRFIIKKAVVGNKKTTQIKGEEYYRSDDPSKKFETLLKRGKTLDNLELPLIKLGRSIREDKLSSIKGLLKAADEKWETNEKFSFYKQLFNTNPVEPEAPQTNTEKGSVHEDGETQREEDTEVDHCNCCEDDCGLKI